ncbi:hypothetical protein ACL0VS_17940 [Chryseobacterium sp. PMSZPI]|uniref:hypothetical protein n=1 Tax=Chryseobacterium sp. PMSZPI TaxID=1033900 RepID=UPI0039A1F3E7
MVLICDLLKSNNYGFRPEELRNLKIKHLDFKEEFIVLDAELGKTDIERDVPMLGNVYNLLIGYKDLNPFGT